MRDPHAAATVNRDRRVMERPAQPYILAGFAVLLAVATQVVLAFIEKSARGSWGFADRAPTFDAESISRFGLALLFSALFILPFLRRAPAREAPAMRGAQRQLGWASFALATVFLTIFLFNPELFSALAREDNGVEWISALALFLGAGLLLWSARRFSKRRKASRSSASLSAWGALLLAGGLFVVGMEEISWMQRVFDIQTPAVFAGTNMQEEMNFHNLFTNGSELIYYGGSFAFLLLLPFLKEVAPLPAVQRAIGPLIPGRTTMAVSAPIASFNYDMCHLMPIQMVLALSLIILIRTAMTATGRGEMALFIAAALWLVVSQVLLIAFGDRLVRLWDPTEYKELFIGLSFACYAGEVTFRAAAAKRGRAPLRAPA